MAGCSEDQPDFEALIACAAPVDDHRDIGTHAAHEPRVRIESVSSASPGKWLSVELVGDCSDGTRGEKFSAARRQVVPRERNAIDPAEAVYVEGLADLPVLLLPGESEVDALRNLRPAIFGAALVGQQRQHTRRRHTVPSVPTPRRAKISSAIADLYFAEELQACLGQDACDGLWQQASQTESHCRGADVPHERPHHDEMKSASIATAICRLPGGEVVQGSRVSARQLSLDLDISAQWLLFTDAAHVLLDQEMGEGMDGSAMLASWQGATQWNNDLASTLAQGSDSH
jgi:hypothetical protein